MTGRHHPRDPDRSGPAGTGAGTGYDPDDPSPGSGQVRAGAERPARDIRASGGPLRPPAPAGPPPDGGTGPGEPLALLLAALSAPARPGELDGEDDAVAAFRSARETLTERAGGRARARSVEPGWRRPAAGTPRGGVDRPAGRRTAPVGFGFRRPYRRSTLLVWVATLTVTATAGATLAAAQQGDTPGPEAGPEATAPVTAGHEPGYPDARPAASRTSAGTAATVPGAPPVGPGPGGPPTVLHRLCVSYLRQSPAERRRTLASDRFRMVITAAGGTRAVESYCGQLLSGGPGSQPDPGPSSVGGQSGGPGSGEGSGRDDDGERDDDSGHERGRPGR